MTINLLPDAAVVRVSRGNFAPARFAEVREMTIATGRYLIPAISRLPGRRLKEGSPRLSGNGLLVMSAACRSKAGLLCPGSVPCRR